MGEWLVPRRCEYSIRKEGSTFGIRHREEYYICEGGKWVTRHRNNDGVLVPDGEYFVMEVHDNEGSAGQLRFLTVPNGIESQWLGRRCWHGILPMLRLNDKPVVARQ